MSYFDFFPTASVCLFLHENRFSNTTCGVIRCHIVTVIDSCVQFTSNKQILLVNPNQREKFRINFVFVHIFEFKINVVKHPFPINGNYQMELHLVSITQLTIFKQFYSHCSLLSPPNDYYSFSVI